jgi:tetratricopeptide (TPR) repeat protein
MTSREGLDALFEPIARSLALTSGFTLMPVEVTGPNLGHALASWLGARGVPVRVVEPLDEAQWRAVVASIVDVEPADGTAAVMLIGPRRVAPGMPAGLRLVNQRRDTIVEGLAKPLLWCGPVEFLSATWERAPDFWSIRGGTTRIQRETRAPAESPLWVGVSVREGPERLRQTLDDAREQADAGLVARVSVQLAEALLAAGEYAEAAEVIDRAPRGADRDAAAALALLRARVAYALGDTEGAARAIRDAEERASKSTRPSLGPLVAAARANLAVRDDPERAREDYEVALAVTQSRGDRRNEGVLLADLGVALLAMGDADGALARLESARALLREVGDERSEARTLVHLGRTHMALYDSRTAAGCFEEALELVRAQGDGRGEARVLCHVARAYLDAGDAEKAAEDAARAGVLARACGDERLVARAEAVLVAAQAEMGPERSG